jgi:hypothetical protein
MTRKQADWYGAKVYEKGNLNDRIRIVEALLFDMRLTHLKKCRRSDVPKSAAALVCALPPLQNQFRSLICAGGTNRQL